MAPTGSGDPQRTHNPSAAGASPTRPAVQASELRKRLIGGADSGLWANGLNPLLVTSPAHEPAGVHDALTWADAWVHGRGEPWSSTCAGSVRTSGDAGGTQGMGRAVCGPTCHPPPAMTGEVEGLWRVGRLDRAGASWLAGFGGFVAPPPNAQGPMRGHKDRHGSTRIAQGLHRSTHLTWVNVRIGVDRQGPPRFPKDSTRPDRPQ
jgi:hypothetical protein